MRSNAPIDNDGQRFGRLVVIQTRGVPGKPRSAVCRCDCGRITHVDRGKLRSGHTRSCGCLKEDTSRARCFKHGGNGTREHRTWQSMLRRCETPTTPSFRYYGGRGIKVCARWHDFAVFLADMGPRPAGTSLDRINNDGDYEPGNCRWATPLIQSRNSRHNRILEFRGESHCVSEWAEILGVPPLRLMMRLHRGASIEETLTEPNRYGRRVCAKGHARTDEDIRKRQCSGCIKCNNDRGTARRRAIRERASDMTAEMPMAVSR